MVEKYGEKLLYIRYRYDSEKRVKYKTVELVEESGIYESSQSRKKAEKIVEIKIEYQEEELRTRVKEAGGKWNLDKKVWEIKFKEVKKLGIEDRINDKKVF
ncbi:MAG: hypothetical protein IPM32_14360 [Ignavibacteriae bacterium]|nr:hypothetical protein [Ignavibacteriota bacterium]